MAPYTYHAATVAGPAAQDAFDVKLNQSIFAAAFALGGLIFLGVFAYLSYWIVGRCTTHRSCSADKMPPKALLLPTHVNANRETRHPPPSTPAMGKDSDATSEKILQSDRRLFWFKKMRSSVTDEKGPGPTFPLMLPEIPPSARVHSSHFNSSIANNNDAVVVPPALTNGVTPSTSVPYIVEEDLASSSSSTSYDRVSIGACPYGPSNAQEHMDDPPVVPPMCRNAPQVPVETGDRDGIVDQFPILSQSNRAGRGSRKMKLKNVPSMLVKLSHLTLCRPPMAPVAVSEKEALTSPALSHSFSGQPVLCLS